MDKEKLINSIMAEYEKEGEPITRADAEEIAEMEIKAAAVTRYTQGTEPKKRKAPARKIDADKLKILDYLRKGLTLLVDSTTIATENETKLHFNYNGYDYTVMLTKHRSK